MAARKSHRLPNPNAAQCRRARAEVRAFIQEIEGLRAKAGSLVSPGDFERHPAVAQLIAFHIAPMVAAGLVDRGQVDSRLNKALGRRGSATLENSVLSLALVRIGRRARGVA